MRQNPAITRGEREMFYPMRGIVKAIRFRNTARGKRTTVDVVLLDKTGQTTQGYQEKILTHVPLKYEKMNARNGSEWTPEDGDLVVVEFFDGNLRDPFVSGYLGPYDGEPMDAGSDPHPQAYRIHAGTYERIDREGNRETRVSRDEDINVDRNRNVVIAGNEHFNVVGERTTIISGAETLTVTSGDVTIEVSVGKATVTIAGKTAWTSGAGIDLIGVNGGTPKGCRQGDSICAYTGAPVPHVSGTVTATP
jgi:hypothetical protein